jgi:tRNA threonylcarbamoyladenosine biosynthesis protein TsaB
VSAPFALESALRTLCDELGGPLVALDTSTRTASVALATRDGLFERALPSEVSRSEAVAGALAELRDEAGVRLASAAAIVVGTGPGSFTGLRVGLATAKGLALGSGVPIYGASSLMLVAASHGPGRVGVVFDARREELFAALYVVTAAGEVSCELDDGVYAPAAVQEALRTADRVVLDEGAAAHLGRDLAPSAPRAAWLGWLVRARLQAGQADDVAELAPRYLRLSEPERKADEAAKALIAPG